MNGRFLAVALAAAGAVVGISLALAQLHHSTIARSEEILLSAESAESGVLSELGAGTTLHGVDVSFRRQGPIADALASELGTAYKPEMITTEGWIVFNDQGALASFRIEKRGPDGTVHERAWVEGGQLVIHDVADGKIVEQSRRTVPHRNPGALADAEAYKAHALEAAAHWYERVAAEVSAGAVREDSLDGTPVLILERTRPVAETLGSSTSSAAIASSAGTVAEGVPLSYSIPYVADLDLVAEVLRWTVRESDYSFVREEVVGVDSDGREFLLESRERTVFEVIHH